MMIFINIYSLAELNNYVRKSDFERESHLI